MKKSSSKRAVLKVAANLASDDPIQCLGADEFQFATLISLGNSACEALRRVKPDWTADSIRANAYLWRNRADIVRAIQAMQEAMSKARLDTVVMTKTEAMAVLTAIARATLDELDEHHIACKKKTITQNSVGTTVTIEKLSPIDAIKTLATVAGWEVQPTVNLTVKQLFQTLIQNGVPKEGPQAHEELLEES